jgi:hypothetical protein
VCDVENLGMRRPWPTGGCCVNLKNAYEVSNYVVNTASLPLAVICLGLPATVLRAMCATIY